MGDKKSKKDKAKKERQVKAKETKAEIQQQNRQPLRIPGAV